MCYYTNNVIRKNKNKLPENFSDHQATIAGMSIAAQHAIYGMSDYPDFMHVIPLKSIVGQERDAAQLDTLSEELLLEIPEIFEQYRNDFYIFKKHDVSQKILGATFDEEEDKIVGAPITRQDSVRSRHPSLSARYAVTVNSTADYTPSIQRILASISDVGEPEYVYLVDIHMSSIEVSNDPYGYYEGAEGMSLIKIIVDPLYQQVFPEIHGRQISDSRPIKSALSVLRASFPKTTL